MLRRSSRFLQFGARGFRYAVQRLPLQFYTTGLRRGVVMHIEDTLYPKPYSKARVPRTPNPEFCEDPEPGGPLQEASYVSVAPPQKQSELQGLPFKRGLGIRV